MSTGECETRAGDEVPELNDPCFASRCTAKGKRHSFRGPSAKRHNYFPIGADPFLKVLNRRRGGNKGGKEEQRREGKGKGKRAEERRKGQEREEGKEEKRERGAGKGEGLLGF